MILVRISAVLLASVILVLPLGQALATEHGKQTAGGGKWFPKGMPKVGTSYDISFSGSASIPATDIVKPASVHLFLNITAIKTGGVPQVSLTLIKGSATIGDNTYLFTNGQTTIKPVSNVDIQGYSEDRTNVLTAFASLMGRLPLSTSDPSSDIGPSKSRQTVTILVDNKSWVINYFSGSMSVSTPTEIRVQTEKTTYDFGDSVRITGNVTRHDEQVFINVINPEGESFTFITPPFHQTRISIRNLF